MKRTVQTISDLLITTIQNNKLKKLLITIIFNFVFFILNSFCFSQNVKIDSLLILLKTDKADTNKLLHFNKLSYEYVKIGSYDSALLYANSALQLSNFILKEATDKIVKQTAQKGEASSFINIGNVYYYQGNSPEALKNYVASLEIREKIGVEHPDDIGNKKGIASAYGNIGNVYHIQGNYPEALKSHLASLKVREKLGDKKGEADSYNNIGLVYYYQGNYPDALKNYFASLKIYETIGSKKDISASYNNIGLVYSDQGNNPEALKNYFASLKIMEEIGNKSGVGTTYNNIGIIYFNQGNYPEALKNYFASLKIKEAIGDKVGIARSYNNIGIIFTKQKQYKEAEEYLIKAKDLSEEIGAKQTLRDSYSTLSELDSMKGNFKGAYENHKLYILYRDSLDNEETRKKTIQSQMTYDFEKKEAATKAEQDKKDAVVIAESKRQKIIIWSVIGGLFLVIVFAGFIFRSLRITHKQKNIIEVQKTEVERAKHLLEEKNKDITDSINYAKRIQEAILPDKEIKYRIFPDAFVLFQPRDIVSGDFYWFTEKNGRRLIAAVDCTGHGVPGAFMSMIGNAFLNEIVNEGSVIQPDLILNELRAMIIKSLKQTGFDGQNKDGMDIAILSFDEKNSFVEFAGANNPLWYIRNENVVKIDADKQPIGYYSETPAPFTNHKIELQKGDALYIFTDGYTDQFGGEKGKKFRHKQLEKILLSAQDKPMLEQEQILLTVFNEWKGILEQTDDVTVIGIRI